MEIVSVAIVIPFRLESEVSIWMQKRESFDSLNGLLEFPGGKVEVGEDPKATAIRETFEETGVVLDPSKLSFIKTFNDVKQSKTISLNIFSYLDSGEFSEFWYSKPEEYWDLIPPANQSFLKDVLSSLKSAS
jgi:8-oxo-dGTP pyrophosphatase MutT (NUDIX family)